MGDGPISTTLCVMKSYKFVIVGGGLTGVTIAHQLLALNKSPNDILIIDPQVEKLNSSKTPKFVKESIAEVAMREKGHAGLGKGGKLLLTGKANFNQDSFLFKPKEPVAVSPNLPLVFS